MAEALVVLLALLSIWAGLAWLFRFQDIALQTSHASRFAAFSMTRGEAADPLPLLRQSHLSGSAHSWADRRGKSILSDARREVSLHRVPGQSIDDGAQPGGEGEAGPLRHSWQIQDNGIVHAVVNVRAAGSSVDKHKGRAWGDGLRSFDLRYPTVQRHTSILVGTGHSASDDESQRRIDQSVPAWRSQATHTYGVASMVTTRALPLDEAWGRSGPTSDWLSPWIGIVPSRHLGPTGDLP